MKTRTTTFGHPVGRHFRDRPTHHSVWDEHYHDDDFAYDTQAYALDSSELMSTTMTKEVRTTHRSKMTQSLMHHNAMKATWLIICVSKLSSPYPR